MSNDAPSTTDEAIEAAARVLAGWLKLSWDGLQDGDISNRFPDWAYNGIGSLNMNGGKPALRRVARAMTAAFLRGLPDRFPLPGRTNPECAVWGATEHWHAMLADAVEVNTNV